jgi:hypothetical protein
MIAMGTVMEIDKRKALVFTLDGSAVYIKPRLGLFVGQQVTFAKKELAQGRRGLLAAMPFAAMAAALAVALVAAGFLGAFGPVPAPAGGQCAAFIALDINPSVQFKIDGDGLVIQAEALNADGRKLLGGMDIKGLPVNRAVEEAIAHAKALGYIADERGVVLVAGILNAGNADVEGSRPEYRDKLKAILEGMNGSGGADVLALYIDDASVKENADSRGLSIGRELLREFAAQNHIALEDGEVRSGRISDLLDKLSNPNCLPVVTSDPSDTPEATGEPTASPAATPTQTPARTDAPAPTDRPETGGVACKVYDGYMKVSWPKADSGDGEFLYYKVVFSMSNPSPKYPDDGYAKAISDIGTTSTTIKANSAYNDGDVGGKIKPGVTYYVSVTYVYENGYIYGNTVRAKCPNPPAEPPSFSGTLNCTVADDHLHLSWTKAPTQDGFQYYKVVFSKACSSPKYPDYGYLYAISDIDENSCNAESGQEYDNGCEDISPLEAGQSYYIGITYVYDDGKYYSKVVHVTMPGEPEPPPPPPEFSGPYANATLDGSTLHVTWKKLPADTVLYGGDVYSGFECYKICVAGHANPTYEGDGYIDLCDSIGTGSKNVDVSGLEPGTWYVAITYYFSDGSTIHSSDDSFVITAPEGE